MLPLATSTVSASLLPPLKGGGASCSLVRRFPSSSPRNVPPPRDPTSTNGKYVHELSVLDPEVAPEQSGVLHHPTFALSSI